MRTPLLYFLLALCLVSTACATDWQKGFVDDKKLESQVVRLKIPSANNAFQNPQYHQFYVRYCKVDDKQTFESLKVGDVYSCPTRTVSSVNELE